MWGTMIPIKNQDQSVNVLDTVTGNHDIYKELCVWCNII